MGSVGLILNSRPDDFFFSPSWVSPILSLLNKTDKPQVLLELWQMTAVLGKLLFNYEVHHNATPKSSFQDKGKKILIFKDSK